MIVQSQGARMLKVTINEKGGGERILAFDKDVITLGRSQRNDVILPRSNVSKKHANVEVRGDSVIIADRGSTNGTFINGRRARTATAVGPEDKVFISDFIMSFRVTAGKDDHDAMTLPPPLPGGSLVPQEEADVVPERRTSPKVKGLQVIEPEEELQEELQEEPEEEPEEEPGEEPGEEPARPMAKAPREPGHPAARGPAVEASETTGRSAAPSGIAQSDAEREVSRAVFEQVDAVLDLERLDPQAFRDEEFSNRITRTIAEVLDAMVDSGQIPNEIEPQRITRRLGSEILGLGPLDAWLGDLAITEIIMPSRGEVTLVGAAGASRIADPFSCDQSRQLCMRKLLSGVRDRRGESSGAVTGRLEGGQQVSLLLAPIVLEGIAAVIRKPPVRVQGGMDGLIERGVLSQPMVRFLGYCIEARQSVLVCDPGLCSHRSFVPAVAGMLEPWERLTAVQCGTEPLYDLTASIYGIMTAGAKDGFDMESSGADVISAVAAFAPTCLIAGSLGSADHLRLVDKARSARAFVLATIDAESEIRGLSRLGSWIASEHAHAPDFVATEIVMDAVDIVVTYARMIDGAERVSRISELVRNKDGSPYLKPIFEYTVQSVSRDGKLVGEFTASHHVPAFVEARKGKGKAGRFDVSIFKQGT